MKWTTSVSMLLTERWLEDNCERFIILARGPGAPDWKLPFPESTVSLPLWILSFALVFGSYPLNLIFLIEKDQPSRQADGMDRCIP